MMTPQYIYRKTYTARHIPQALIDKNEATSIPSKQYWDIQQVKEKNHVPAIVIVTPTILLLLIIFKFIF